MKELQLMTRSAQVTSAVLILGLVLTLGGCDLVANIFLAPDDIITDEPVTVDIGLVAPLTGRLAALHGIPMERGFLLARDEINESEFNPVRINFITEDNMSTIEGSVAAVERLVDANVPAIVGFSLSTHAEKAFPVAQENRVVTISPISAAAGLSSIGDYIFRVPLAVDKKNPAGVRATHAKLGYERVAIIYNNTDVYSTSSREHFTAALMELGVEVVTTQTFQTSDTDFTTQLTAIMELKPDVVFISAVEGRVPIMIQGREIGITAQYILPHLGEQEVQAAGDAADGAIAFANWSRLIDNPINQAFIERYRSTYGSEPDTWAALGYETLHILHAAIVESLSTDTVAPDSASIRDALAEIEMDITAGQFSFDPNGDAIREPVVLVVKDGEFELFNGSGMDQ